MITYQRTTVTSYVCAECGAPDRAGADGYAPGHHSGYLLCAGCAEREWKAEQMEGTFEADITVPGYGVLTGEFTRNKHGYFCWEVNGLTWDQAWGVQAARATAAKAATALLRRAEAEDGR